MTSTTCVGSAASSPPPQPDQRERRQEEREPLHAGVPGLTASRTPLSSATRASDAAKTFETPRLEPGSSVSPASGYSRPSVVTPSPRRGARGGRAARRGCPRAFAPGGSRARARRRAAHRARRARSGSSRAARATRAGDRAALPPRRRGGSGRGSAASAASSASSRSVASFAAGWRSIRVPARSNAASPAALIESKSPIARSTWRPSASAASAPPSAATTNDSVEVGKRPARSGGNDDDPFDHSQLPPLALPRSGSRVGGAHVRPLSPVAPSSPYGSANRSAPRTKLVFIAHKLSRALRFVLRYSGVTYAAVSPPSTRNVAPFTYDDSSLARKRAALTISRGFASRPIGRWIRRRS